MISQVRSALEGQLQGKLELMLAVQRPTWSSEGHLGALGGSKDVQERSKSNETAVQAQLDSKQRHPTKTMVFHRKIDDFAGSEGQRSMEK